MIFVQMITFLFPLNYNPNFQITRKCRKSRRLYVKNERTTTWVGEIDLRYPCEDVFTNIYVVKLIPCSVPVYISCRSTVMYSWKFVLFYHGSTVVTYLSSITGVSYIFLNTIVICYFPTNTITNLKALSIGPPWFLSIKFSLWRMKIINLFRII